MADPTSSGDPGAQPNGPGATGEPGDPSAGGPEQPGEVEAREATVCVPGVPGTTQIPRLTNAQYNRTIADLVGATPPGLLAIEQAGPITKAIWDGYRLSADNIAASVMADPELKSNFLRCTPEGDGVACLSETIREFGRRAYRRPLTDEEAARFDDMVARRAELTATGSVDEIAQVILATFLKSPSFLQRSELAETADASGNFKLSGHEVASRLSYMLWGTMPDDELSLAADNEELQTKEQVLAQARRMVSDPKARDVAAEFHRHYLELTAGSRWDSVMRDQAQFPTFSPAVVPDMINDVEMLFDAVYSSGGTFQDLLTTNIAFVTANTAPLYGLDPSQFTETPQPVELDATLRPGFLTRVGFLAAYSAQTRTSPILRGAFITKEVLGIDPGSPDPNALDAPLPNDPGLDTNRKRVEAQTSAPACAGCHAPFINPPGFVLEVFDAIGAQQTNDPTTGAPIDGEAEVIFSTQEGPKLVTTPAELAANIAASPFAQARYASRWVSYAYNRVLTEPDVCTVEAVSTKLTAGNYSIQDLLTDLTQTDSFTVRATEVTQ